MLLNKNNSSNGPFDYPTSITGLLSKNFSFDHQFLIANNSSYIQDPKISLFLQYLSQHGEKRTINQTFADAYKQSNLIQEEILEVDNLNFVVKINKDVPLDIAILMFGYCMPLLLIITVLFNSMIVIVLSQKHLRTPTNMVLMSMAIFDMLTLMFPAPWYFYAYFLGKF